MEESEDARRERLLRSQRTARYVLLVLAIAIPLALHFSFEREATRLDSIGEHEHAASNRSFAFKAELFVAGFFLLNLLLTEWKAGKLRKGQNTQISARTLGRVLALIFTGCALAADFAPEVRPVLEKAFGAAPLGVPVVPFMAALNVLLMLPYFWVCEHSMRIVLQAAADRASLSRGGLAVYIWQVAERHPELASSRKIALAGLAYFVLLAGSWIVYAQLRGF